MKELKLTVQAALLLPVTRPGSHAEAHSAACAGACAHFPAAFVDRESHTAGCEG